MRFLILSGLVFGFFVGSTVFGQDAQGEQRSDTANASKAANTVASNSDGEQSPESDGVAVIPSRILARQYAIECQRAMKAGNNAKLIDAIEKYLALEGQELPGELYLEYAKALFAVDRLQDAQRRIDVLIINSELPDDLLDEILNLRIDVLEAIDTASQATASEAERATAKEDVPRKPAFRRIGAPPPPENPPSINTEATFFNLDPSTASTEDSLFEESSFAGTSTQATISRADSLMKLLRVRHADYMEALERHLRESLNREVIVNPPSRSMQGTVQMYFTIDAQGQLSYMQLNDHSSGHQLPIRAFVERVLINAQPFDPPPEEVLNDPLFKRMSVTVNVR